MSRSSHILHTEQQLLHDWGRVIHKLFDKDISYGPYHVGSSLKRNDYRDIDLRVLIKDEEYDRLSKIIDFETLGIAVSLWGQKVTGMPIDYQVQRMSDANAEYKGEPRNAIFI